MGENLHNDKLEQFLRESLSNYQENPPDAIWEDIEAGIPPTRAIWPYRKLFWWIGTFAVICILLLIFQYNYFHQQIEKLKYQVQQKAIAEENKPALFEETETDVNLPSTDKTKVEQGDRQKTQGKEEQLYKEKTNLGKVNNNRGAAATSNSYDQPAMPGTSTDGAPPSVSSVKEINNRNQTTKVGQLIDQGPESGKRQEAETKLLIPFIPVADANSDSQATSNQEYTSRFGPPGHLSLKEQLRGISIPVYQMEKEATRPRVRKRFEMPPIFLDFTAGAFHLDHQLKIKENSWPNPDIPIAENAEASVAAVSNWGIQIGLRLNSGFSVISGILWQNYSIENEHTTALKKEDRLGHNLPSTPDQELNYQYQLNSFPGVIDVSLSLRQNNDDYVLNDSETFEVAVQTRQEIRTITIPVILEYQLGKSRLRATVRSGFMLNFHDSHLLEVQNIQSTSSYLSLALNANRQNSGQLSGLNQVTADMSVGIGFTYDLHPAVQFQVMPTFNKNISNWTEQSLLTAESQSIGMVGNLRYIF